LLFYSIGIALIEALMLIGIATEMMFKILTKCLSLIRKVATFKINAYINRFLFTLLIE